MLLVTAVKASIFAVISRALSTYLEVSVTDIEAKLLQRDASLRLQNVKVREQKIPLSIQSQNVMCFLIINGTINALELDWTWSSSPFSLIDHVKLRLRGLNLKLNFRYEKESEEAFLARSHPVDYFDQELGPNAKPDNSLFGRWQREIQRVKDAVTCHVKDSSLIQQTIRDIINSFSIRIDYSNIDVHAPFTSNFIRVSFDTFHLGTDKEKRELRMRSTPLMVEGALERLSVELHHGLTGRASYPIVEPFTFEAAARRVAGARFQDLTSGYELIVKQVKTQESAKQIDHGIILHWSDDVKAALSLLQDAFQGESPSAPDYDAEIYRSKKDPNIAELWPTSMKLLLSLVSLIGVTNITIIIRFILRGLGLLDGEYLTMASWIIFFLLSTWILVTLLDLWLASHANQVEKSAKRGLPVQHLKEYPAIYRLPLPFITVIAENDVRMNMANVVLVGRMDFTRTHFSATSFTVKTKKRSVPGPQVSSKGIRARYQHKRLLVNVDLIDDLYIPGKIHLVRELESAVIVFEEGKMTIKLKAVTARLLSDGDMIEHSESLRMSHITTNFQKVAEKFQVARRVVKETGMKLSKETKNGFKNVKFKMKSQRKRSFDAEEIEARNRLQAEVYEGLVKLQRMAGMFELIPVQKHRQNFRLYPNSFRGTHAVDYILQNNIAPNRPEAVKLLRDFEVEFGLFESVTREYKFRDQHDCLYRFVHPSKRRFWLKQELPYDYVETFERTPQSSVLPFPIMVLTEGLILVRQDSESSDLLTASKGELHLQNGKLSRSVDFTILARGLRSKMIAMTNARLHGIVDPEVPKLIHRFQVSLETLTVNPEYTIEDWFHRLGLVFDDDDEDKSLELRQIDDEDNEPYSLPHMFVSDFKLQLTWKGLFVRTNEATISVQGMNGTESSSSAELIKDFVIHVLGRAPGILSNVQFMGVNITESSGVAIVMNFGSEWIPGGQYISLGAMALYDFACVAIDAGKAARHDPTGDWQWGDFPLGVWFAGLDTARAGAKQRGKTTDDFYDEDDRVQLDPLDFAVGAAYGIGTYANTNKARFMGATLAAFTAIGLTVALGPLPAIAAGIVVGSSTELALVELERRGLILLKNYANKNTNKKLDDKDSEASDFEIEEEADSFDFVGS